MSKYNVAILGCGAIFNRHLSAIQNNSEQFKLVGLFDIDNKLKNKYTEELAVKSYATESQVYTDPDINCIIILTPSSLHYQQALLALLHGKHVIIEKPATFLACELDHLENVANDNHLNIFCILQVRLNPAVIIVKKAIEQNILGALRGVSLIQRWQRPISYFSGWRGTMASGGGILREFGIHYIDVLQYLAGMPKALAASSYKAKFKQALVDDTVYALIDFGEFGGSIEVSIAAEPKNLECTLSITGDNGFVKLGGKSLDEIVVCEFLEQDLHDKFNNIKHEVSQQKGAVLVSQGASPYHPELYRQIILNPNVFELRQTRNVIKLVEDIYGFMPNL